MRVKHLLRANKTSKFPEHIIFFDVETFPENIDPNTLEQKFRLGVALYWKPQHQRKKDTERYFYFTSPYQFFQFVFSKCYQNNKLYLIAHNIDFDFRVIQGFKHLKEAGFKLQKLITNYSVQIWKFRKDKASLCCLDNMNYFNQSLEDLGRSIGVLKLPMPDFQAKNEVWFSYCQRDVEIMKTSWQLWLKFIKSEDLGMFAPTLAGQAFNVFRHRFMGHPIYIHNNKKVINLERESYRGGRNECFFIGQLPKENYYHLDVSSMYPYLMRENEMPTNLRFYFQRATLKDLKRWLSFYSLIAKVLVETPEPVFGVKREGKLCFPTGQFQAVLTTDEIKYSLTHNYLKKVYEIALYDKAVIFKDFVDYFYQKRLEYKNSSNFAFSYLCKLLLNSLYGKFGQRNEVWQKISEDPDHKNLIWEEWDMDQKVWSYYRAINGLIEKKVGEVESFNSFPAISSHITAQGRLYLWSLIKKAGFNNVFYVDTDSLITNEKGFNNLKSEVSNTTLGSLKVSAKSSNLEIRNLKDYTFADQDKRKGIKKLAQKFNNQTFSQWHFQGIKSSLRKTELNKCYFIKTIKKLKTDYLKGWVLETGKVRPFEMRDNKVVKPNFKPLNLKVVSKNLKLK